MMNMTRAAELPKLGWTAHLEGSTWDVLVGSGVDTSSDDLKWFEGAWAGEFEAWGFVQSAGVFGSGGHHREDTSMHFVGPSHPQEGLCVVRGGASVTVSNSLALALWRSGCCIDRANTANVLALIRVVDGATKSPFVVHLLGNQTLELHLLTDVVITLDGTVRTQRKPNVARFDSYDSYLAMLSAVMRETALNACSQSRTDPYSLLTSISSGYDSPACSVFARQSGCEQAFSIDKAKQGADSGREIAVVLGISVSERPPAQLGDLSEDDLALMYADGFHGEDMSWLSCRDLFERRLIVTGFNGDRIWTRNAKARQPYTRAEVSGNSLSMLRITEGWIHLPLPFVGEQFHEDVAAISNASEMDPWSVASIYDRPVPRRIVEEQGVDRDLFGFEKRGVSVNEFRTFDRVIPAVADEQNSAAPRARLLRHARIAWWKARMWCRTSENRGARRARNIIDRVKPGWEPLDVRLLEHSHIDNLALWVWATEKFRVSLPEPSVIRRQDEK